MTLDLLIKTLKKSGVNSKKQVIQMLETNNIEELLELQKSISSKVGILLDETNSTNRN